MVNLLLILVSITTEDRKPLPATAIICSHTAFVLSPVLLPSDPLAPRAPVSCWNGFEGRCSSSPLLSLPLFPSWLTYWAYWEKQREGREKPGEKGKEHSPESDAKGKRVPQQRRSMGLVYVAYHVHLHFQHSIQCSVQISTTLHFRVKSPWKRFLPCRWDQKGQRNTTSYTPTSCETPVITPHFSSPQLSLLLLHTIPTTDFVTANDKGKIINTGLEHCSSKIKFCPLNLEILKQLCQKQTTRKSCLHFFPNQRSTVILAAICWTEKKFK